jgi:hypothetical protein
MHRSKRITKNKRRLHKSNTSGGAMLKPSPDVESGGARITPLNQSQESPVTIIKSKKKTYQLRQDAAYRKPGEA